MSGSRMTYRFGPLERRGILGPLRLGQAAVAAAGILSAVIALDAAPGAAGALVALCALGATAAVVTIPIGRRGIDEWAPVLLAFLGRAASGRRRWRSALPARGFRGPIVPRSVESPPLEQPALDESALPGGLRDVRVAEVDYGDRRIGVLSERGGRRLTAVLACRVSGFSLLDPEAQERRLARWGRVLSGAAASAVTRIGWIERTAPAQGDELARWLHSERDPAIPLRGTPIIESYLELIGTTAAVSQEHEILVAVQVDARRVRERGRDAVARSLVEATERVVRGLESAEVTVLGALSRGQLARTLRTAFDPFARSELAVLEAADPTRRALPDTSAWPLAAEESWEAYRSDGALHATFWVGSWPRVEVSPMFMDALLGRASAVRTVAVTFEPMAPERSTREAEAAITRDRADRELRHRFGQSETARQRQAQEAALRREAELAAGHAEVRFAGFITVSARDRAELRHAIAEVLDHAARARLELHRMWGQQAEAFTFTLPLCRGLR